MHSLKDRPEIKEKKKLYKTYKSFQLLIELLTQKELDSEIKDSISQSIDQLNSFPTADKKFSKYLHSQQREILKQVEKKHKWVPVNYYRNLWTALGMSVFGMPIGLIFSFMIGNMAYLGLGLPIGLAIGAGVGSNMDKKAKEEGRQLDVEVEE